MILDTTHPLYYLPDRDDDDYEATRITGGVPPGAAKQTGEYIAGTGIDVTDVQ